LVQEVAMAADTEQTGWERWHDWQVVTMRPITDWFVEAVASPGARVLDVACGTGLPSLAVAERVGPTGSVLATDLSPRMIGAAQRKAAAAGASNISHRVMSLPRLELADGSFDAVTCKEGLMFCPDLAAGAEELTRVVRRGGRVAVSVWDEPARNPFFTTVFGPLMQITRRAPPDPDAPGPFRLAAPGRLEATLRRAGLGEISITTREIVLELDSLDLHWQMMVDMATPVEEAARSLSSTQLAELRAAIAEALRPFTRDGRVRVPNTALCAVATRP
jgi:SAM-dependent methyltransferase